MRISSKIRKQNELTAAPVVEKPTRKRRTKAEIEADEAAAAALIAAIATEEDSKSEEE